MKQESFLPKDYSVPASQSDYTKLQKGANKLRILSAPIMGWEYWTEDHKPVRAKEMFQTIPVDADISNGWNQKHFWALVVWNHDLKQIQIWQPTQKTIQVALQELIANEDWGDPRGYNITVNRTGEGLKTEYSVQPSPHSEIPADLKKMFEEKKIDLNALFVGGNPFEASERNPDVDAENFQTNEEEDVVPF